MQKNYKRLGDYIQELKIRNSDGTVKELLGINIDKYFMPSVANVVGTDLTKYKIVQKNQFACNRMHVGRDYRIPIAMSESETKFIVSPAYDVFEITDTNVLLPEYLMMWFSRAEFDRNAWFYTDSDVRGGLNWEAFCDLTLPIPDIDEQQALVDEYQTIERRIQLNEQLCQKLEETAQALYRKYFVEDIDPENLPEGWRWSSLDKIAHYLNGLACQKFATTSISYFPAIKIRELNQGFTDSVSDKVTKDIPKEYIVKHGDVVFSWSGTLMIDFWCDNLGVLNQHLFKVTSQKYDKWFFYLWTKSHIEDFERYISAKATSMGHIKREDLSNANVLIPSKTDLSEMNKKMNPIFDLLIVKKREVLKLKELLSLLLVKMGRKEEKTL
jgi:type I restriction enzyme S subunit